MSDAPERSESEKDPAETDGQSTEDSGEIYDELFIEEEAADAAEGGEADDDEDLFLPEDEPAAPAVSDGVSLAAIAELQEKLESVEAELADAKDRLLRKTADLQNARKRYEKERSDQKKYAAEGVLKEMVSVMDDLDRALEHIGGGDADPAKSFESLLEGVQMVHRKFASSLGKHGVVKLEGVGEPFDPTIHEAIQQVDDDSVPHNHVLREFQCGYLLHDRLLRPALVVVAKNPPPPEE